MGNEWDNAPVTLKFITIICIIGVGMCVLYIVGDAVNYQVAVSNLTTDYIESSARDEDTRTDAEFVGDVLKERENKESTKSILRKIKACAYDSATSMPFEEERSIARRLSEFMRDISLKDLKGEFIEDDT